MQGHLPQGHLPQGHLPAAPSYPQQQFVQQQIRDASQYMANHFGINVEQMAWRPPWAYQPELSPDPAFSGRSNFMPAFVAHPTYSQTAGPPAPPRMGAPLFPDYYAQQRDVPLEAVET